MKTAVLGATGYTGGILLRLLAVHPEVREIIAVSSSQAGTPVRSADPGLSPSVEGKMSRSGAKLVSLDEAVKAASAVELDVVFSALPHLKSAEVCGPLLGKTVVIDLSADFRLKDPAVFVKAYGAAMPRPDLSAKAVYGLAEWRTEQIRSADIVAVPGCYPTATLLPVLPLSKAGILRGTVIVNAISGISGAGRKEEIDLLYVERSENVNAYSPGTSHRHASEIAQEIAATDATLSLLFTPHMAPLRRGMAVTTVVEIASTITTEVLADIYRNAYGGRPFVSLTANRVPQTRDVWGSNRCDIGWRIENGYLMLFSVIDNLVKGASGQAVQDMNIRFGIDECAGLPLGAEL
jgi:N-acetyl-gamma-glutamyl-phosphate reductase